MRNGSITANLGGYGRISLRFTSRGATKTVRERLPKGCHGSVERTLDRAGTLSGTLKLATHTKLWRTVSARKLKASSTEFLAYHDYSCPRGTRYQLFGGSGALQAYTDGKLAELTASATGSRPAGDPFVIDGYLTAEGEGNLFAARPDLAQATIFPAPPLFTGRSAFQLTSFCSSDLALGTLSSPITAHFDLFGSRTYSGAASLARNNGFCSTAPAWRRGGSEQSQAPTAVG